MVDYNPALFKQKREILGLSQKQLADECCLSVMTIHNVETKNHVYPSTNLLVGLVLDIIATQQGKRDAFSALEGE